MLDNFPPLRERPVCPCGNTLRVETGLYRVDRGLVVDAFCCADCARTCGDMTIATAATTSTTPWVCLDLDDLAQPYPWDHRPAPPLIERLWDELDIDHNDMRTRYMLAHIVENPLLYRDPWTNLALRDVPILSDTSPSMLADWIDAHIEKKPENDPLSARLAAALDLVDSDRPSSLENTIPSPDAWALLDWMAAHPEHAWRLDALVEINAIALPTADRRGVKIFDEQPVNEIIADLLTTHLGIARDFTEIDACPLRATGRPLAIYAHPPTPQWPRTTSLSALAPITPVDSTAMLRLLLDEIDPRASILRYQPTPKAMPPLRRVSKAFEGDEQPLRKASKAFEGDEQHSRFTPITVEEFRRRLPIQNDNAGMPPPIITDDAARRRATERLGSVLAHPALADGPAAQILNALTILDGSAATSSTLSDEIIRDLRSFTRRPQNEDEATCLCAWLLYEQIASAYFEMLPTIPSVAGTIIRRVGFTAARELTTTPAEMETTLAWLVESASRIVLVERSGFDAIACDLLLPNDDDAVCERLAAHANALATRGTTLCLIVPPSVAFTLPAPSGSEAQIPMRDLTAPDVIAPVARDTTGWLAASLIGKPGLVRMSPEITVGSYAIDSNGLRFPLSVDEEHLPLVTQAFALLLGFEGERAREQRLEILVEADTQATIAVGAITLRIGQTGIIVAPRQEHDELPEARVAIGTMDTHRNNLATTGADGSALDGTWLYSHRTEEEIVLTRRDERCARICLVDRLTARELLSQDFSRRPAPTAQGTGDDARDIDDLECGTPIHLSDVPWRGGVSMSILQGENV